MMDKLSKETLKTEQRSDACDKFFQDFRHISNTPVEFPKNFKTDESMSKALPSLTICDDDPGIVRLDPSQTQPVAVISEDDLKK